MATIAPVVTHPAHGTCLVTWSGAAAGDTLTAITGCSQFNGLRSVQAAGTFNTTAITLNGALDPTTTPVALKQSIGGSAISLSAAGAQNIAEMCDTYQPVLTGGTGTGLTVKLLLTANIS